MNATAPPKQSMPGALYVSWSLWSSDSKTITNRGCPILRTALFRAKGGRPQISKQQPCERSEIFVENYFNYFTEIEEHFQRRRGSLLLLSTLDWALIETWREAGVPLEAVLRGIDAAFDKYEARQRKGRMRRVNGLAYCAQAVISAIEDMKEASAGAARATPEAQDGFEQERVAQHLERCAEQLRCSPRAESVAEISQRLEALAGEIRAAKPNLEDLEAKLTAMEEKLFAILISTMPEPELLALRQQAASELAPYRSRMQTVQIRQIEQQFLHKRLLERFLLPRISLFYMSQS